MAALFGSTAFAEPLSDLSYFARCYSHLTGLPLPLNHPLRASLNAGTANPIQECHNLVDQAQLNATTYKPVSVEGQLVLNGLYEMHRTWFAVQTIPQVQGFDSVHQYAPWNVFDGTEGALALTYNAFFPNSQYRDVLRYNHGFIGLRTEDSAVKSRIWDIFAKSYTWNGSAFITSDTGSAPSIQTRWLRNFIQYDQSSHRMAFRKPSSSYVAYSFADTNTSEAVSIPTVQIGDLTGVRPQNNSVMIPNYVPALSGIIAATEHAQDAANTARNVKPTFDFFQTEGGGVLGTPSFMLLTFGHEIALKMDGAEKLPRRWIKTAMDAFVCSDFPMVRESDVLQFVSNSTDPSTAPFRKSSTCVQCHATLDQAASLGRNRFVAYSEFNRPAPSMGLNRTVGMTAGYLLGAFNPNLSVPYSWSHVPVPNYHLQNPSGRLFFRSHTGRLIDQPLTSIVDAGTKISDTDDYYTCAAKRYVHHFTGLNVPIYDRGDPRRQPSLAAITPQEVQLRKWVEQLGKNLKSHQSLRQLIKDIMASDLYRDRSNQIPPGGL